MENKNSLGDLPNLAMGYMFDLEVRLEGLANHVIPDINKLTVGVRWPLLPDQDLFVQVLENEDRAIETFISAFKEKRFTVALSEYTSNMEVARVRESSSRKLTSAYAVYDCDQIKPVRIELVFSKASVMDTTAPA
jgi:hypothetical protein